MYGVTATLCLSNTPRSLTVVWAGGEVPSAVSRGEWLASSRIKEPPHSYWTRGRELLDVMVRSEWGKYIIAVTRGNILHTHVSTSTDAYKR
jgi:hypothetical protein